MAQEDENISAALSSVDWWENYFAPGGGWEKNGGRQQTQLFAEVFCRTVSFPNRGEFSLIDVGCALGEAVRVFHNQYPHARIFGYDFSSTSISRCRAELGDLATFMTGSLETLENYYDVIYISNVLEHFSDFQAKARLLMEKCSRLCIMVPYKEYFEEKTLRPDPGRQHQVTFVKDSFNFLIKEGLVQEIHSYVVSCPGVWSWTRKQKIIEYAKNPIRLLLGRRPSFNRLQIIYDIKKKCIQTEVPINDFV